MISRSRILAVVGATVVGASPLLAAAPDDAIASRVAGLRELGAAFKSVRDTLRDPSPQIILLQMSTRQIVSAAHEQYQWFPAGSGPAPGRKTAAKALIWSDPTAFKKAQDDFAAEAQAFQHVVAGGNVDAIRSESGKLGQTCKGCHDQFREQAN